MSAPPPVPPPTPPLKLVYFDVRGRGELARLTLVSGGLPFEDARVKDMGEFLEMKADGRAPMGMLPILHVGDRVFSQSYSIAKYCAKLAGLHSEDPLDALDIEMIVDNTDDMRSKFVPIRYMDISAEEKLSRYKALFESTLPPMLGRLELLLADRQWFACGRMTVADVAVFNVCDQLGLPNCAVQLADAEGSGQGQALLGQYPKLAALRARVAASPAIAAYLAARRPSRHGME